MVNPSLKAVRGAFVDFVDDPFSTSQLNSELQSVRYLQDGLLIIEDGKIIEFDTYSNLSDRYAQIPTEVHEGLILPGFIDLHVHYPQTEMIGAYGEQLLAWLDKYVFPTESKFRDVDYARQIASFFLDELLRNGTTSAVVLTTIFPASVDVLFEEAQRRNMRLIAGQVLMSRNAPEYLLNEPQKAYAENRELIQKWHGQDRLLYAITPRFAITSTDAELKLAAKLKEEYPDLYIHTHLSENLKEIEFTAALFPTSKDYLNVYEQFDLVGDRSIFAHCVHLDESAFERMSNSGAAIAYCPTSNLFLGSGLFKLHQAKSPEYQIKVGIGSDVGAGTSFSQLKSMGEAYKISQLQGQSLSAFKAFYLATLGGAKALSLDDKIGSFDRGKEADFVVLDVNATPLQALRNRATKGDFSLEAIASQLFGLMTLGDERSIKATYVAGKLAL
ncbi:guanine deaminase [Synechococcus sp. PCC 7502]|uniref:guanine deaminase n=1 Tax=Synechococcus sp. PCC 7502 TaxID=1173263 RepID=UPI00029FF834|nr:guanine deaminase [Synechococcus sp. PCC 7502]AFY72419.1 guanine deaminase [Synechococcus sp. PCC 7502]